MEVDRQNQLDEGNDKHSPCYEIVRSQSSVEGSPTNRRERASSKLASQHVSGKIKDEEFEQESTGSSKNSSGLEKKAY